jgi:hypothetical protein
VRARESISVSTGHGGEVKPLPPFEKFLEGTSEIGRDLFRCFVTLIEKCGPFEVAPAKTRVAFMAAVRFASVKRALGVARTEG